MLIDLIPDWLLFFLAVGIVLFSGEIGFLVGRTVRRKAEDEMESPVSTMAGVVLGLLSFMLAFTFDIVSDRYDLKKALVRDEANVIRTTWNRADFLPEAERAKAKALLYEYVERRIAVASSHDVENVRASQRGFVDIQQQLWDMAVANGQKDMNSDIGALYVESVNQVAELHATRIEIALNARVPTAIWITLLSLLTLGMICLGYHCAIAESRRSRVTPILAVAFSLVLTLIAALDNPGDTIIPVPQEALVSVLSEMKVRSVPDE